MSDQPVARHEIGEIVMRFMGRNPRKPHRFVVSPRYTAGDPGQVSYETVLDVCCEEILAHAKRILGQCGEEQQMKARREGVGGIAECCREDHGGWKVLDMLTGEVFHRDKN